MTQPLNIHTWKKMSIRKVKVGHLTTLSVYPVPSVWSEIWERKHLKSVLDGLAYIFNQNLIQK